MIVARIENANIILGRKQGYIPLPVRIEEAPNPTGGEGYAEVMVSAWTPTPDELAAIADGANVHVKIFSCGYPHPPIRVEVGPRPGVLVFQDGVPA